MTDREVFISQTSTLPLCRTFSTDNVCLRQTQTGDVYGSSVIDVIEGYDEEGKPFSRFTYVETDEKE